MKISQKKTDRRESRVGEMNLLPGSRSRVKSSTPSTDSQVSEVRLKRAVSERSSLQDFTFG